VKDVPALNLDSFDHRAMANRANLLPFLNSDLLQPIDPLKFHKIPALHDQAILCRPVVRANRVRPEWPPPQYYKQEKVYIARRDLYQPVHETYIYKDRIEQQENLIFFNQKSYL
jgi:hypothetical protein